MPYDWRTFRNENFIITVFAYNDILYTASNCFKFENTPIDNTNALGTVEILGFEPRFSVKAAETFATLTMDDLCKLEIK